MFNRVGFKWGVLIMTLFLIILLPLVVLVDRLFANIYTDYVDTSVEKVATRAVMQLEKEPALTAERINLMLSLSNDAIIVFNKQGKILSRSAYEFFEGETIGTKWRKQLETGKDAYIGDRMENATGARFHYIGMPLTKDGQYNGGVLVMSNVTSWYDTMQQVRYWILRSVILAIFLAFVYTILLSWRLSRPLVSMTEATKKIAKGQEAKIDIASNDELGTLGKGINELSVELNNYRKNRSELLANISHELRTPVSYLQGYAQLIEKGQYASEADLKRYASIIDEESVRLSKLIQDVFDLSKMEEGMMTFYEQAVDIEELLEGAVNKVSLKARAKSLALRVDIDGPLEDLQTDGMRFEQIILNLLQNAVNYTERGEVVLRAYEAHQRLIIEIRDTGVGIPEADLPFIFDRFHRVEKSRVRDKGGTGLGLAIVKALTESLSGEIHVESVEGKGTIFRLSFLMHTFSTNIK